MLKRIVFVYEDSKRPNSKVREITGDKTYGQTILKRKTLKQRIFEEVEDKSYIVRAESYTNREEAATVFAELATLPKDCAVVHMRSSFGISDKEKFQLLMEKAQFVQSVIQVQENHKTAVFLFPNLKEYLSYAKEYVTEEGCLSEQGLLHTDKMEGACFADLSQVNVFLQYITSGYDARFFTALSGNHLTETKRSTNKKKNKSQYE